MKNLLIGILVNLLYLGTIFGQEYSEHFSMRNATMINSFAFDNAEF